MSPAHNLSILMEKKLYATTSIAYANSDPHIGYALELIQADAWVRFFRQQGNDVFFLTGTDEHGVKIARAAEAAGENLQEFVDGKSQKFYDLKNLLNLSWDDFIRTTDKKRHWPGAQKMWRELVKSGDIYKKKYKGLYCVGHEAFVTEKDLVNGICADHQKAPEVVEEENWFFRLSKYSKEIEEKIKSDELKIVPESRKNEILSLFKEGLEDISFSRPVKDLSWGVPVPDDDTQVMYVWCDALTNYISAIGYGQPENQLTNLPTNQFTDLWPADVHFIGKDILRFHAAIWPGMLLAAGLKLPKTIFVHGHITMNGQKMSKSIGNIVSPNELVEKYGADAVRYFLLREIPTYGDGDFSFEKFEERYNGELANGLGNLAARILTLGSKIQLDVDLCSSSNEDNLSAIKKVTGIKKRTEELMNEFKFNDALASIWTLIAEIDGIITKEKPWENLESKKEVMVRLVYLLQNVAKMITPFMPSTSEKILKSIDDSGDVIKITKPENLFPRI